MAYIIIRNKRTGYVSMVEKGRVDGESRTIGYVCGLGAMSHTEFKHFQKWAHSIKDQRMRKERVLACPLVATETTRVERKVTGVAQQKTTVKRAQKKKPVIKVDIKAKEKERKEQRERYEKKHGIKKVKKTKKVEKTTTYKEGIQFTGKKTIGEKKRIIGKKIAIAEEEIKHRIANEEADIAGCRREKTSLWKIAPAQARIAEYKGVLKTLKKQRSELRR